MLDGLLGSVYNKKVVAQVEKQVAELTKNMNFADAMKTVNAFTESAKLEYYRKFGFDMIDGDATNFSIPDYSMKFFCEHKEVAKEYTNVKFSHLGCLCFKPETLK